MVSLNLKPVSLHLSRWAVSAVLTLPCTAAALTPIAAPAHTWPVGVAPDQRRPRVSVPNPDRRPANPWAYGDRVSDSRDDMPSAPVAQGPYGTETLTPAQLAQRCNTGRLVGGLLGGGLGYGLSRQDGRAWAIPLGALLGSQMGCSTAVGNGPRPW